MTKTIAIVGLLFLLVSCNQSDNCQSQTSDKPLSTLQKENEKPLADETCTPSEGPSEPQDPQEPTEPTDPTDPQDPPEDGVPPEASLFEINSKLSNFDANDEVKVKKAFEIIKKVVATKEFKDRVINYTYKGQKTFVDNGGHSNEEVYQKILDGSEDLNPGIDHTMDLDLELYYSWRSTVGYTYANVTKIWMNTKYFDPYTPCEVAGNVFHEWTHKLGFEHASSYSTSRDSSVPYALGYLMEELGKKFE